MFVTGADFKIYPTLTSTLKTSPDLHPSGIKPFMDINKKTVSRKVSVFGRKLSVFIKPFRLFMSIEFTANGFPNLQVDLGIFAISSL